MRVLQVHNRYRQAGGEDVVVDAERALLEQAGHTVIRFERHNDEIGESALAKIRVASKAVWARDSIASLERLIAQSRPDVAHFHNTFPLISAGAYSACRRRGLPVVQTLHNYRLVCPAATLFRAGQVCEECLGGSLAPAVRHACYRDSRAQSAVAAATLFFHRRRGTWHQDVDRFIALTAFAREKLAQGGLPRERIVCKPNFVAQDPGARNGEGRHVLYLGRLSPEKGLDLLARAWNQLPVEIPLIVAGDGPLRGRLESELAQRPDVRILGAVSRERARELLSDARFLVVPSGWYEGFPMTVVEAFACGVPVLASRLGSLAEIVGDRVSGRLLTPGDSGEWSRALLDAFRNPEATSALGKNARRQFEELYGAERNLSLLESIYQDLVSPTRD